MILFLRDNPEAALISAGIVVLLASLFAIGLNVYLVERHDRVMGRVRVMEAK